jgi:acyl-CoA reductase-like NAD-dependent aldehyde dehydrogenase
MGYAEDSGVSGRQGLGTAGLGVVINNMTDDPQAPWGGFKYSGVGREYGRYGIEAFLEPKAILG